VHFNHTGGNASLRANSLTLRKLHVGVPGKNNWGLLELLAPNLELFMFVGGYSVCFQGARAVADTRVRLPRFKAFCWDISNSDSYGNPGWYTHAQLDGNVQCKGSAELALSKLLLDPLRIEAVGIALSPQGFDRLKAASHSPFALPLYLQALSLEQHASGASGMHFELPIDTSTAAALRWLKISLKCTFETQLCRNLAISCPMLEHGARLHTRTRQLIIASRNTWPQPD
jgi:hypothetical protein